MKNEFVVLGAGITGLSADISLRCKVFERESTPGGICNSYYIDLNHKKYISRINDESYRFEKGGGHWIFGASKNIFDFINSLSKVKKYYRKSAVYLPDLNLYASYPIQNNLIYLPKDVREKAIIEILSSKKIDDATTLDQWLKVHFGKTLCELFFFPFHDLYTAGLYTDIVPQDNFKTPINEKLIMKGFKGRTSAVGYNNSFVYPKKGLDDLINKMAKNCDVAYNKKIVMIDKIKKEIFFEDGATSGYDKLISTLPLNKMLTLTSIKKPHTKELPYTSVLEFNIGAGRGRKCPLYHWIYMPKSKTGFFRIGFYSNVDRLFLPKSSRNNNDRVSMYVEKSYRGGKKPSDDEVKKLCKDVVAELQKLRFISDIEVIEPTWIDVAYTWEYPNCMAKETAIAILKKYHIYQTGRYGKWKFQGIADSIKDGLMIKSELKS